MECRLRSVYKPYIILFSKPALLSTGVRKSRVSLKVMPVFSEHAFQFSISCLDEMFICFVFVFMSKKTYLVTTNG